MIRVSVRRLSNIANARPQAGRTRRQAEHSNAAAGDYLYTDNRPHQGCLAAAAGAEQAGDRSAFHGQGDAVQNLVAAANYTQSVNTYGPVLRLRSGSGFCLCQG